MLQAPARSEDPIRWCWAIALAFLALCLFRLAIPSKIYFDEIHYVPAARQLLALVPANNEHPLVGKELIAASIALLGDKPFAWRLPSVLLGTFGLFAWGRMLWWASGLRFATISGMVLLATGFAWFIQSRIAMLDMAAASMAVAAFWQVAAALRLHLARARRRLIAAGVLIGLALGAKWSVATLVALPGLAFLALRLRQHGWRFLTAREGAPVPGMSLLEAGLWLGLVPLATYWLTFMPAFFYHDGAVSPFDFVGHHEHMITLQDSVKKPHPYQSKWYHWVFDWRAIWYLYEPVDGAQRGVLLVGNPLTMIAGLPALGWALWAGLARGRDDALALALAYLASLGFWVVSDKPVTFYYHYLVPGTCLLGCLALALDETWRRRDGWRWLAPATVVVAAALFAWFWPILSAAPLAAGKPAYVKWMWLNSWR